MLIAFDRYYSDIFNSNRYIASSTARAFYNSYIYYVGVLKDPIVKKYITNMSFAVGFTIEQVNRFVSLMDDCYEKVDRFNERYIEHKLMENKEYFDNILKSVDPNVMLDEEQRRAVVTDDDYCLLIAGTGAGKTTTMAAKVKYLVEKTKNRSTEYYSHFIYK